MSLAQLPANIENISMDQLAEFVGHTPQEASAMFPTLRVNYDDEDDDKNSLPRGQWTVAVDGKRIFAPTVKFQVLHITQQYSHFDPDEGKMVNQSVHFRDFKDDIPDIKGGQRCGSIPRRQREALSKEEQDYQRNIKLAQVLCGLVTLEGVDAKGNPASAENVPCIFYAKGTHYMPMANVLESILKNGKRSPQVQIDLGLERQKNGGVVYWEVKPEGFTDVQLTPDHFEAIKTFRKFVEDENENILSKYHAARRKMGNPDMKEVLGDDAAGIIDVVDAELNDELGF